MKALKLLAGLALLAAALLAAALFYVRADLLAYRDTPFGGPEEKLIDIPPSSSARAVVRLLAQGGALSDERRAWRYLRWVKRDKRQLRAGEYSFEGPLTPDQVLERVYRGEVKTYRFTVPEGLRMDEIAAIVEDAGLGKARDLLAIMRDPAAARELGVPFHNLEGYLFPDTYGFSRNPKPRAIVDAMVERFRQAWRKAEAGRLPGVNLSEKEAVTLASIIEKETGRPEERPHISCVFYNRLRRHMRLQTDPTVMYATMLRHGGHWSQNITRSDLQAVHPYNTYTSDGLPPGPIANPGEAALAAALHPSTCNDLYFVSRNDGTHVFCPDLACHNAAVRKWQVEFFRRRSARSSPSGGGAE